MYFPSDPRSWLNFKPFLFVLDIISCLDYGAQTVVYTFNIRNLTDKMHRFYASLGHQLFEMVEGQYREESTCCPRQYASVLPSLLPNLVCVTFLPYLCEHSLWDVELQYFISPRMSLWCSPVIYMSTALASVFITGTPLAVEPVVFHTIKFHIWLLSCQGCKYLSFFLFGGVNIRILDSLIYDFIRMKYYRI